MIEGNFQPTYTAIHYAKCRKRIEEMGMHFSMKRFITAIMMATNIKTIDPDVINGNLVIDDEWPIDGICLGTKKIWFRKYQFNIDDEIINTYRDTIIDDYDNQSHKTKNVIIEHLAHLFMVSLFTLLPITIGFQLSKFDSEFLFAIGIVMICLGVLLLIPGSSIFMELRKNEFLSKQEMQQFVAKQHKKIDHTRNELINCIAERYVYENELPYTDVERYIVDEKLDKKSLLELLEMSS